MASSQYDDFWKQMIQPNRGTVGPAIDTIKNLLNNDDWKATCSLYANHKTNSKFDSEHKRLVRSIEIPLASTLLKVTFGRAVDADFEHMRVWVLPPSKCPVLRLSFLYRTSETTPMISSTSLPDSILSIELLTAYPHTWPYQCTEWLNWLHEQCSACLLSCHGKSNAVCEWMEHHALDFFGRRGSSNDSEKNCSCCIDYEAIDGFRFLVFSDKGPKIYDVESLSINAKIPGTREFFHIVKHLPNCKRTELLEGSSGSEYFSQEDSSQQPMVQEGRIHPMVVRNRDDWCPFKCEICLECNQVKKDMENTPCGHFFCKSCLVLYFEHKVEEIAMHRDNTFRCPIPSCQYAHQHRFPIVGFVKQFLTDEKMDQVRAWYKDLKNPVSYALPDCISQSCPSRVGSIRKEAVYSTVVQCETCHKRWCEWCLQRLKGDEDQDQHASHCQATQCLQFCNRYLAGSPQDQAACEAKWPWISVYARSRIDFDQDTTWLFDSKLGQICPVCKNGVQRTMGCNHMHCKCGAHFCYNCGDQMDLAKGHRCRYTN